MKAGVNKILSGYDVYFSRLYRLEMNLWLLEVIMIYVKNISVREVTDLYTLNLSRMELFVVPGFLWFA